MIRLIREAITKRKITLFILAILITFGIYNYIISPRQETPEITPPIALITAIYPGASPEDIESLVTDKIEKELKEIPGYDYSYSYSQNSVAVVVVRLEYGTDIDKSWDETRQTLADLQNDLPNECEPLELNTNIVDTAGMIISMSSSDFSYEQLVNYAEDFQKDLNSVDGISKFDIDGVQDRELIIEIDYTLLAKYNLSYSDVVQLLKIQNIEIPSGTVGEGSEKVNVKVSGIFNSVEEIEDIVLAVSRENGSVARLKDVADIKFELADSNYKIIHDGENAILLTGYFKKNKNIVEVGKEVNEIIADIEKKIPKEINFTTILDQPETVDASVRSFAMNLVQGVIFVVIVVFVGMGLRNAIIVSTAIPSAILITFAIMNLLSINIHQISIAALIVALGMLVDNAIVVSDAIQVRIDDGQDKLQACLDGVKEVIIPVLTSTLTTLAAFLPLLLLNSVAGEYLSSLPTIVMLALVISFFIAIFITPTMAFIFFKKGSKKQKVSIIRNIFNTLLKLGMKAKIVVVVLMMGGFYLTYVVALSIGLQFFPFADTDMVYIDIKSEQTANLEATEELVYRVIDVLNEDDTILNYTASIGDGLPKFYQTMPLATPSKDYGQVMLKLDITKIGNDGEYESLTQYINKLQEKIDEKVFGGKVTVKQLEQGEPIGAPVVMRLSGSDLDNLGEASKEIVALLEEISGTTNVKTDFDDYNFEYFVDADRDRAGYYGISKYDIQNEVSIALYGREAGVYTKGSNEYTIKVRSNIKEKDELDNLMIKSSMGPSRTLLKNIASVKTSSSLPVIRKYDSELTVTVYSDVEYGYSPIDIQNALSVKLKTLDMNGVEVTFSGEKEKINENFGDVGSSAVLALVLVYLILLIQFNSFTQPLVILLTIPLSIFGSVIGLYVARQPLSFTAILGMVSLLGIVVNNAIVLVDFINSEIKKGSSVRESCFLAVEKRFRPIMLSTITTVIGLTPLVYSGGELFKPLAISLMSGLMISTLLTLVVTPIIYSIFIKDKKSNSDLLSNSKEKDVRKNIIKKEIPEEINSVIKIHVRK